MSTTHIRYFEDEGDDEVVTRRCAHCKKEVLPSQAQAEITDPDSQGETLLLHDGSKPLDCLTKWYDARRSRVQADFPASLQSSRT